MKKFYSLLGLLLITALPLLAEHVTQETAQKVAATFLNNNGVKSAQLTDLSKDAGFPNLYIFNAPQGFVVMAADDCATPILGYSLKGRFVVENMPSNARAWLQGYNDEIQYAIDNQLKANSETAQLWKDLAKGDSKAGRATIVVDALIQSTWDQDPGYNDLCPYDSNAGELTVTGCVATAMAQIMRYWEFPSHGTSSHSYTPSTHPGYGQQSVNYANATYDWSAMPLHSNSAEVAKLMYHCGVSVDMDYDVAANGGSGAYSSNIPNALKTYFYYQSTVSYKSKSSYSSTNWNTLIKTELNAGRPVEYNGSGSDGGHAFVCDGYDNSNYFHFNWGWSGANDGFYLLSNLTPGSGGSGGGSYSFTNNQSAVFGIQPKDCSTSTPTNFNVTTEGRNALLTWNATSNAVSYSIYRNGLLIANTTSTNYTDSNLSYGSYDYYVKSRDSYGAASSPTTTITVAIEPVPINLTLTPKKNGAKLNWTEPEWAMPQNDDEVLTYGDGSLYSAFGGGSDDPINLYFGHKYPSSMLSNNKVMYKVSFYATMTGTFSLYIYTATAGNSKPQNQVYTQTITVSGTGWNDIILNTPYQITTSKDLWVFIYDPEGKSYPMGIGQYTESTEGSYIATSSPTSAVYTQSGYVMLIRTCITDGTYSYNLYDNNTIVAQNLTGTSKSLTTITDNTAHQYILKTNYNGSETSASNMAGITRGTATITSLELGANDNMIIAENGALTVSGALVNSDAANLILENGAQLIHNTEGVKATVKKAISAYSSDNDNWYFIASPVMENITPNTDNGLLANDYDLFLFDQSEEFEWRNIKAGAFSTVNHKIGYLYANSGSPTLGFEGTLASYTEATSLTYDESAGLKGFNLIGNPYPCNTTINKDFYIISNNAVTLAENGREIAPCEGVFVKASETGECVIFTKANTSKGSGLKDCFDIVVTQGKDGIDRARVRLTEGIGMEKYCLDDKHSQISIWQNEQDYAVAHSNGTNELAVNFKAKQNGIYTLTFEAENLDLNFLHLIDNLTGTDIDLLATPSYSFDSKITDYPSRFRLVFSESDNDDFINDTDTTEGEIQILDMTGRVVGNNLNMKLTPGVYVLRVINGNNVKTKKIIIQ